MGPIQRFAVLVCIWPSKMPQAGVYYFGTEGDGKYRTHNEGRCLRIHTLICALTVIQDFALDCRGSFACRTITILVVDFPLLLGLQVRHVIHFDLPQTADAYTHRSGRAAHRPEEPRG